MIIATLALASLGLMLALAPAQAQTTAPMVPMACTQAELAKMDAEAAKMTDATKKTAMMKEITMAKEMMAKNDMKGCTTSMENAMKMMPGKS